MVAYPVHPNKANQVPRHVAIIMDGNGRWARRHAMPRPTGHQAGITPVRDTVEYCTEHDVKTLTLFAFSSENWRRPADEISGLMTLFVDAIEREVEELDANGIRLRFIGNREQLSESLCAATRAAEQRTANNTRMELVVAVAYGGRWDITQAARQLARQVEAGEMRADAIDEARVAGALQTSGMPNVDLLIRTGGEKRISNFLLWDIAYSEVFFSEQMWPEFGTDELTRAFGFYAERQRRFGRTGDQTEAINC